MIKTEYKQDWKPHNGEGVETTREATAPADLDLNLFDDDQINYLIDYLADYRLQIIRVICDWITKPEALGQSKKSKDAANARIVARAVILDTILNKRDYKVLELKTLYGISTHQYYDELNRLTEELGKNNKNIGSLLRRN